jgi:alkanesulfonate monooxygenase SsuD/methylene tetrahydromethanopterin reductase-like flavin-dependent oxidoreductase (luciferase family)
VRIGVLILPEDRWPVAAEKWRRAEKLGFDHAWTYDHIAWGDLRDGSWFASIPTLTAAAMVTDHIRLGTLVASPNFRHPVPFARELVTLDDITRGRLTLGLGSGGHGWDATVLGQESWSEAERADRFMEFVHLLDRLLRHPEVTFRGRYWTAQEARTYPGSIQEPRIPFAIAATGPISMRVAAKHASVWVTNGDRAHQGPPLGPDEGASVIAGQLGRFERICDEEGRDPTTVDCLVLTGPRLASGLQSPEAFEEVKSAYAAVGVTDLVFHWPRSSEPYAGDDSILERVAGKK